VQFVAFEVPRSDRAEFIEQVGRRFAGFGGRAPATGFDLPHLDSAGGSRCGCSRHFQRMFSRFAFTRTSWPTWDFPRSVRAPVSDTCLGGNSPIWTRHSSACSARYPRGSMPLGICTQECMRSNRRTAGWQKSNMVRLPSSPTRTNCFEAPLMATEFAGKRACAPKTLPLLRWQRGNGRPRHDPGRRK